jgi:hypothetical protein
MWMFSLARARMQAVHLGKEISHNHGAGWEYKNAVKSFWKKKKASISDNVSFLFFHLYQRTALLATWFLLVDLQHQSFHSRTSSTPLLTFFFFCSNGFC